MDTVDTVVSADDNSIVSGIDLISDNVCWFLEGPINTWFEVSYIWIPALLFFLLQWHLRYLILKILAKVCGGKRHGCLYWTLKYLFPNRYLRVFGRNVILLYIFFHSNWSRPFIIAFLFAIVDNLLLVVLFDFLAHGCCSRPGKDASVKALKEEKLVNNIYKDFSTPIDKVLLTFFSQVGMMGFFIFSSITDEALKEKMDEEQSDIGRGSHFSKIKWVVTILLCVQSGKEDAKALNSYWWHAGNLFFRDFACSSASNMLFMAEFFFRFIFDILINNIFHAIVRAITVVVMPFKAVVDFMFGALSLFFITNMDDMGPQTFKDSVTALLDTSRSLWFEGEKAYQDTLRGGNDDGDNEQLLGGDDEETKQALLETKRALLVEWFGADTEDHMNEFWKKEE